MPRPRKWESDAERQLAYRIRKEREQTALTGALLELCRAIRQARGPLVVNLDGIPVDDQAAMVRRVAQAISAGTEPEQPPARMQIPKL